MLSFSFFCFAFSFFWYWHLESRSRIYLFPEMCMLNVEGERYHTGETIKIISSNVLEREKYVILLFSMKMVQGGVD